MKQIRRSVFETNSSSTHSITICTKEEFDKFRNGQLIYDDWAEELIQNNPITRAANGEDDEDYGRMQSFDEFFYNRNDNLDAYSNLFETPSGDKMVAFGYFGYDG